MPFRPLSGYEIAPRVSRSRDLLSDPVTFWEDPLTIFKQYGFGQLTDKAKWASFLSLVSVFFGIVASLNKNTLPSVS